MSCECIHSERLKARKEHRCTWCGQKIDAGQEYLRQRVVIDGDAGTQKFHLECDAAFNEAARLEGGGPLYFEPGSQPRGGSDPDGLSDSI